MRLEQRVKLHEQTKLAFCELVSRGVSSTGMAPRLEGRHVRYSSYRDGFGGHDFILQALRGASKLH